MVRPAGTSAASPAFFLRAQTKEAKPVADVLTIPIPIDPTVVNIDERKEVEYRCKEWGCTEAELMDAVAAVGVDAPKVEAHLINAGHKRKAPLSLDNNR
jgi:hypothetical protein